MKENPSPEVLLKASGGSSTIFEGLTMGAHDPGRLKTLLDNAAC